MSKKRREIKWKMEWAGRCAPTFCSRKFAHSCIFNNKRTWPHTGDSPGVQHPRPSRGGVRVGSVTSTTRSLESSKSLEKNVIISLSFITRFLQYVTFIHILNTLFTFSFTFHLSCLRGKSKKIIFTFVAQSRCIRKTL